MDFDVLFSSRAYCKMVLHAAKYPHCAISGILLSPQKEDRDIVVDSVPLFHQVSQSKGIGDRTW